MKRSEENISGGKTDKLIRNLTPAPPDDQRPDRNSPSGESVGEKPGKTDGSQPSLSRFPTEPLSEERRAQMMRASQVARSKPLKPLRRLSPLENTPVPGTQPLPVSPIPPEPQPASPPVPQPDLQLPLSEAVPQQDRAGTEQQPSVPAKPAGTLSEKPQGRTTQKLDNMLPLDPSPVADRAPTDLRGSSATSSLRPVKQEEWKQWIARLQTWKLFSSLHAILLFAPITWTWLSVGLASLAYSQSLERNPDLVGVPFLRMWVEGFPGLKKTDILGGVWHPSLILDVGVTVFLLLGLAFFTWIANYPIEKDPSETLTREERTLHALDGAVIELRDILAALKSPVAAIETSVAKMGGSYANFESIAGQIRSSFNELSSAAPILRRELRALNDEQREVMLDTRKSAESMQEASQAMREMAEPFRKEGIDKIVHDAVACIEKLDILQKGISQQQMTIYDAQQKLQAVLNQQVANLQHMRASQPQVDLPQIILALEQAGYSLHRRSAISTWFRKGCGWLKKKLIA